MNIEEILLKKAMRKELAHFYLLETSLPEQESADFLMGFCHSLIRKYFQQVEKQTHPVNTLMDHPDVLVITGIEEKKDYTVEDAIVMEKFFSWNAVQSQRKFVVIPEAHRITQTLANKWLKLLEEPIGNSTIFLLNPRRQKLIETIHSRAQHLRLPFKANHQGLDDLKSFLTTSAGQGLAQFIDSNSKEARDVFFWSNELIYWEAEQSSSPESKMALVNWLKTLKEMETFHQPAATKWTLFYSYLQQYVLNRLSH